MWRDIFNVLKKFILIVLPLFIVLPLYCACFPMYYLDEEYAMYRQQKDFITDESQSARVLIIGDSRTKAGLLPNELGGDCYNLALGGTTPIEGYYTLKTYLANHETAPEYVFVAYAPMHYMDIDTLWTRNIYFHIMDSEDATEVFEIAKGCADNESILMENYHIEYLMYQTYMPNKYATALKKSGFVGRHSANVAKYEAMTQSKGQNYFGLADGSGDINGEAKEMDFAASETIEIYMDMLLDLCAEHGIQVVVEQLPMNETSTRIIQPDFSNHYREYMYQVMMEHPEAVLFGDFYTYSNDVFGDADHLNETGAKMYCDFLKERYPAIFTGQ